VWKEWVWEEWKEAGEVPLRLMALLILFGIPNEAMSHLNKCHMASLGAELSCCKQM
jgi:hypothetical protein